MEDQPKRVMGFKIAPALVLDFDGTVRRNKSGKSFIDSLDDIELMPGIEDIIWKYRDAGYMILGISNQAGVAHGFKPPQVIMQEFDRTFALFKRNPFHTVRQCFNDSKGNVVPYNIRSLCRKPDIGMLALMEFDAQSKGVFINWDKSIFVGDREDDRKCAENAKIKFHWIDEFLEMKHLEGGPVDGGVTEETNK